MKYTSWFTAGILAFSLAACDRGERREQQPASQPGQAEQAQSRDSARDSKDDKQVVQDQTTEQSSTLGQKTTERDEAGIKGMREKITRETEKVEEDIPTVVTGREKADINRMSSDEFVALGLPENAAKSITKYRDDHGNFASVDDLSKVPGMDSSWLQKNRNRLGVERQAAGEAESNR